MPAPQPQPGFCHLTVPSNYQEFWPWQFCSWPQAHYFDPPLLILGLGTSFLDVQLRFVRGCLKKVKGKFVVGV